MSTQPKHEPVHPGANATDAQMCKHWKLMDRLYKTPSHSPLHHDSRCPVHVPDLNVWGTDKSLIDPDEYCVDCERDLPRHYANCPTYGYANPLAYS